MLTAIKLGNFKAFGETQTIPIRPLTLIFGPNSGGKSSIIHGLLFAREARRVRGFDIRHTEIGGTSVDLGGFPQYVYQHNSQFTVDWGVEQEDEEMGQHGVLISIRKHLADNPRRRKSGPCVQSVSLSLGGQPLLRVVLPDKSRRLRLDFLDCSNVRLGEDLKSQWIAGLQDPDGAEAAEEFWRIVRERCEDVQSELLTSVLAQNWRLLKLTIDPSVLFTTADELDSVVDCAWYFEPKDTAEYRKFCAHIEGIFDQHKDLFWTALQDRKEQAEALLEEYGVSRKVTTGLIARGVGGGGRIGAWREAEAARQTVEETPDVFDKEFAWEKFFSVAAPERGFRDLLVPYIQTAVSSFTELDRLEYLGPLRSYPHRHLTFSEHEDSNWRAGGGNAWRVVLEDDEAREKVNKWLGDEDRLSTTYKIVVRKFREVQGREELVQVRLRDCQNETLVTHRDVGIGVSQVLPVLVRAFGTKHRIHCIEQPEIHLHPALQAELGDVFIKSALKNKNTFLLETHSEHLILRIMRRMRETARKKLPVGMPKVRPTDVAILYVQPGQNGAVVQELRLDEEGQLMDPWPGGFFEEGFRERFSE